MIPEFSCENEVWEFFRGPQGKEARKALRVDFKRLFPKGHRTSLRELVKYCTHPDFQKYFCGNNQFVYMTSFHPRAFQLILAYGQDYTPKKWKGPPEQEPVWRGCFQNADFFMRCMNRYYDGNVQEEPRECVYVEGLVDGSCAFPMLHAWNASALSGKKALDWSWYTNCHWYRYFGIPFTQEEFLEANLIINPNGKELSPLLHSKNFEKVEYFLYQLLERREETRIQEKLLGT